MTFIKWSFKLDIQTARGVVFRRLGVDFGLLAAPQPTLPRRYLTVGFEADFNEREREDIYIYVHIYTYIYIHINIYRYMCKYVYI